MSLPSLLEVADHALQNNKVFCFNLSAGYVLEFYKNSVEELLPYVDLIFGNDHEFTAFAAAFGIKVRRRSLKYRTILSSESVLDFVPEKL